MKRFTREELARYNGKGGAPSYIAYQNKVYDMTDSPMWPEGDHQGSHGAGEDLTDALLDAPHGDEVLEDFPLVGELAD
ncbi:MAG: cytochrome b5 domain-containing protein [Pseudomonadota bacterium]